jgi:serine/threonine-protein kinase PknK
MTEKLLVHPRYEPLGELGRGAQGVVLRVRDREAPDRALVAKVWRAGRFAESVLEGEFALLRRLDVPGLVRAHDVGRDERGAPFFVEDYVEGKSASEFVVGPPAERATRLFHVLCEVSCTLAALHEAAFIHGDLKPEHVRVTGDERVYLLDLGAAVASTRPGDGTGTVCTPAFAAPELLAGERPTVLSELYSLGALAWALACGAPPDRKHRGLRSVAPWVPPSLADLVDRLLEPHPRDRPESALVVLGVLGVTGLTGARRAVPAPVGRERELSQLATPHSGVRYLVGASGMGKSHLLRELVTRALLSGRAVRRVAFPSSDGLLVSELLAFFRGQGAAWPFSERASDSRPLLLALDDLDRAPPELTAALDAFRCRTPSSESLDVIAVLREAPDGAEHVSLGPLTDPALRELCARLGITDSEQVAELSRVSRHNPGFLVAARGRVPLTRDMVLERTRELSPAAKERLALVALLGGVLDVGLGLPEDAALLELLSAGLLTRRASASSSLYGLQATELAPEIDAALGSLELAEQAGELLLRSELESPRPFLALASFAFPPSTREALLEQAAELAERAGLASEQADALLALAASPARRSAELLTRLERVTRGAGINHPEILSWLSEAARREPALEPLALRRQAEQAARSGDFESAEAHARDARKCAARLGDRLAEALALGTEGAVALYRANVSGAEAALRDARARLATLEVSDLEELARVDHNAGVVALYRDRVDDAVEAFERSLVVKRRLGDRAGVRSCLLNLGLAQARRGHFEDAARTLTEAHALAQALRQHAGRAWCLAARADVELRRGRTREAERCIAEAEAISQAPPSVRADLGILRGQLALASGNAEQARMALAALDPALREKDAMIDARARLVEAGALLASLPASPRAAARLAIAATRAARRAQLPEVEAQSLALLRRARQTTTAAPLERYTGGMADEQPSVWSWLERVATGTGAEPALAELLATLQGASGAERVLLACCDASGTATRAWGVDFEGYALPSALERCDPELLRAAVAAQAPLYQRDVTTRAGRGSRLALPVSGAVGASGVLVLEHRFRAGCFDALSSEHTRRFAVLAGLATRLTADPAPPVAVESPRLAPAPVPRARPRVEAGLSTALPSGEPRRQFSTIIGQSRALRAALSRLDSAVDSELPVLIIGETGTGKELFARALHDCGPRAAAPFVAVNCAAIPEALFEAELFGHARGAFTGAERARGGLLSRAEHGTLFLDEIGELPLPRQATLLRVLESRRYRPIGSDDERSADVRIVAATNRVLEDQVARGAFRQDLLYRINVIEVRVPALRERPEDIPELVRSFLARSGVHTELSPAVLQALEAHPWPGNVRELEHQIQRLLALGLPRVELAHLPRGLRQGAPVPGPRADPDEEPASTRDARREVERALARSGGNITHAARALGLTRHGLKKRMLRLGLRAAASGGESS